MPITKRATPSKQEWRQTAQMELLRFLMGQLEIKIVPKTMKKAKRLMGHRKRRAVNRRRRKTGLRQNSRGLDDNEVNKIATAQE